MKKFSRLNSPGFRTDLIFPNFNGLIIDRGEYLVIQTPSNPGYFFGNFILFFEAPRLGTCDKWKKIFQDEFRDNQNVKHFTFAWDSPSEGAGEINEFRNEGFHVDFSSVLTAESVNPPPKYNNLIEVRAIASESEWREVIENQILSKKADFTQVEYRVFKQRQMTNYQNMAMNGLGNWFGAFLEGKLVGDLGLFYDGALGRFQSVETHPDYMRQGICGTLVYEVSKLAFEQGAKKLVMVADENYHAAKIYESVGFAQTLKEYSDYWFDKNKN